MTFENAKCRVERFSKRGCSVFGITLNKEAHTCLPRDYKLQELNIRSATCLCDNANRKSHIRSTRKNAKNSNTRLNDNLFMYQFLAMSI